MDQVNEQFEEERPAPAIGEQIRAAREQAGLSLAQVSAETRISQRHLEMIEAGEYGQLPARTYAIGFSRTVAKVVGLDENEVVADVRAALDEIANGKGRRTGGTFEPGDPARIPSARLGWVMVAVAVILVVAGFVFFRGFFTPAVNLPPLEPDTPPPAAVAPQPANASPAVPAGQGGQVVFTAMDDGIWVKFYDASGQQLMQKQMAKGETYAVPAAAQGPMVWTGRPDALAITVGGRAIPRLADKEGIVKDVPVTAEALMTRKTTPAPASPVRAVPTPATPVPAAATPAATPRPAA
ncbi:MAG: helix-turn-helix domain-containing protein [Novosphingobium sp.]|nr:helix-turn-helix domain-containing protein [Novosphingobium sp.]